MVNSILAGVATTAYVLALHLLNNGDAVVAIPFALVGSSLACYIIFNHFGVFGDFDRNSDATLQ